MSSFLLWSLPGLPTVAGGALALVGRHADRVAARAAMAIAAVTLAMAIAAAIVRPVVRAPLLAGLPAGLAVDGLSAVLVVTVASVVLAVVVFAAGEPPGDEARFFGFMLLFAGAMLVTVTATDLVVLLMAWEVMGAMSYALIGFWWRDPDRMRAADLAFLTTRAGDMGLYLAAGGALAGTAVLSGTGPMALDALAATREPWRDLVAAGVVAAALGKSAQLPFSFWLSRAMAGPSPVSALLHSATMVAAGAYLLLRLEPLLASSGWAGPLVGWAGALTALLLSVVAIAQSDLKQLLAASTCAQLGFMVLAAGTGAVAGGTAHLVAHAAVKSLLFLGAGAWLAALGTQNLAELHGAARRYPLVGTTFGVGALALAGVPPLSLWITEDTALTAAAHEWPALYAVGQVAAALSAVYAGKVLIAVWRPAGAAGRQDAGQPGGRHVERLAELPMVPLAVAAALLGVLALGPLWDGWQRLTGDPAEPPPGADELAATGVLSIVIVLAMAGLDRRAPAATARAVRPLAVLGRPFAGWLYLEPASLVLLARPVLALARSLARFDDRVVDGGVRLAAAVGGIGAGLVDRRLELPVDSVVRGVGRGARRLGALARRPQTGQVHTYYAQAAVLLLVLAVVLIAVS